MACIGYRPINQASVPATLLHLPHIDELLVFSVHGEARHKLVNSGKLRRKRAQSRSRCRGGPPDSSGQRVHDSPQPRQGGGDAAIFPRKPTGRWLQVEARTAGFSGSRGVAKTASLTGCAAIAGWVMAATGHAWGYWLVNPLTVFDAMRVSGACFLPLPGWVSKMGSLQSLW